MYYFLKERGKQSVETDAEGSTCILCKQAGAQDMLEEGKPVHTSCVLIGKQLVVTAQTALKRESPVLRDDWRVTTCFRDIAHSMNIAWFRGRLRNLCAYLRYLRRKFVEYRLAMRKQRETEQARSEDIVSIQRRITIARNALASIRRMFDILQEIAATFFLRPFTKGELATVDTV